MCMCCNSDLHKKYPQASEEPVLAFIEHLLVRVVDKAEYRAKTTESMVALLLVATPNLQRRLCKFLVNLARNVKVMRSCWVSLGDG